MPKYNAYWINPAGNVLPVKEPTHIADILKDPKKFKLSKEYILGVFDKYNEKLGMEGKAREEVMTELAKVGWIRIRFKYGQGEFWVAQPYRLDKRAKENIWYWVVKMSDGTLDKRPYDQLVILPISQTGIQLSSSFKEVLSGKIFETKKIKKNIQETSLARLWQHMKEHDTGLITAFRSARNCGEGQPYTKAENLQRNKSLLSKLLSKGYSVTSVKGSYIENYGHPSAKEVGENVFFVSDIKDTGNLEKDLRKLGEEFEQDSILYIKSQVNAMLIGTNHCPDAYPGYGTKLNVGRWQPGKEGQFFTRVSGRPFVFSENLSIIEHKIPTGFFGKWACDIASKLPWEKL